MSDNYYTYKNDKYSCENCNWTGIGNDLEIGENFDNGFEIICPKCTESIGTILFPKIEDVLIYGTEADKLAVRKTQIFRDKWNASLLKDISQLPELYGNYMAFILRENMVQDDKYIVITYKSKLVWKEICAYEYYDRFIELGKLFKEKYGNRLIDIVPDVDGYSLYGDRVSSIKIIEDFRKQLRNNYE